MVPAATVLASVAAQVVAVVPEAAVVWHEMRTPPTVQILVDVDGVTECSSQVIDAGTNDRIFMLGLQAFGATVMAFGVTEMLWTPLVGE